MGIMIDDQRVIDNFYFIKGDDAQNVSSNKTATLRIPTNGLQFEHYLRFLTAAGAEVTQAQLEAEVTNIKLKIGGDVIIDLKTAELNMVDAFYNDYKGASIIGGIMRIVFAPRNLAPAERRRLALGTAGVSSIVYEFTCGTLTNVAKIESYVVMTPDTVPLGTHIRLTAQPISFNSTGDNWVSDLEKTPGIAYKAMHMDVTTGTLLTTSLTVDTVNVMMDLPAKVLQSHQEHHKRNPQTNWRHLVFDQNDELGGFLPMSVKVGNQIRNVNDLRLKNNWSVTPGGSYRIVQEKIWGLVA